MDCELCGAEGAMRVAVVDGVKMVVCDRCVKAGREVREEVVEEKGNVVSRRAPEPEKTVVADCHAKVKEARQRMELEQKELAKSLNEKQSTISKIEKGTMTPTLSLARKLEKKLGVTLVEETEPVEVESEGEESGLTLGDILKVK